MNRYNLQLFNLNLHIFVTAETVSRLLGLIRWRGNLSLSIIACWVGYRVLIEWGDKGAQLNFAIWMYSSQSATETEGVDATWRDYWLRVEVSSEDRMASELWWRLQSNLDVVRFQNGDPEIFPIFCHWTRVVILAGVNFCPVQMLLPLPHLLELAEGKWGSWVC